MGTIHLDIHHKIFFCSWLIAWFNVSRLSWARVRVRVKVIRWTLWHSGGLLSRIGSAWAPFTLITIIIFFGSWLIAWFNVSRLSWASVRVMVSVSVRVRVKVIRWTLWHSGGLLSRIGSAWAPFTLITIISFFGSWLIAWFNVSRLSWDSRV